jgi:hypothetical protein
LKWAYDREHVFLAHLVLHIRRLFRRTKNKQKENGQPADSGSD